ncbi:uncharacterized protein LJ264_013287 [Porphyrio hochstetteri]
MRGAPPAPPPSAANATAEAAATANRQSTQSAWVVEPGPGPASLAAPGMGTRTSGTGAMGVSQSKRVTAMDGNPREPMAVPHAGVEGRGDNKALRSSTVPEGDRSDVLTPGTATDGHGGLIQPRKVPNPMRESWSHRELHRELLFSHSRGILPRHRAELPRVLESRRLRQLREELRGPPSDLEQQLRKRHQRLEEHERETAPGADPDPLPEFLLVRDSLKKMKLAEPSAWQM